MKPRPRQLASVQIRVGLDGSKKDRVGAEVNDCLIFSMALSNSNDHINSFRVLRGGQRGLNRLATVGVLRESWFTRPMKEHSSLLQVAVGNFMIASVVESSM
jgi:hypothetical protein